MKKHFAYFITPHGFGHAARSAAVMSAMLERQPDMIFDIFTAVPEWFFLESIQNGQFYYHFLQTDVGLVQHTSMSEDLEKTLRALDLLFESMPAAIQRLSQTHQNQWDGIFCDISPLGLQLAKALNIPSYLIENFTWDWIYESYLSAYPEFKRHIITFEDIYRSASCHIQTEPFCTEIQKTAIVCPPISRKTRESRQNIRQKLKITPDQQVVLVTMGGIPTHFQFVEKLKQFANVVFVIPGSSEKIEYSDNLRLLPHHSSFYHPDLLNAADAILGKAGYSTIAEAYWAGIPFGYFLRESFRESGPVGTYIRDKMDGIEFSEADFETGRWVDLLTELIGRRKRQREGQNGADFVAELILKSLAKPI